MNKVNIKFSEKLIENKNIFVYIKDMCFNMFGEFNICEDDYDYFIFIEDGVINII